MREESSAADRQRARDQEGETTHHKMQGWRRDLGLALGFHVWIASNDSGRLMPVATGPMAAPTRCAWDRQERRWSSRHA